MAQLFAFKILHFIEYFVLHNFNFLDSFSLVRNSVNMLKNKIIAIVIFLLAACSRDSEPEEKQIPDNIAPEVEFAIAGFPENPSTTEPVVVSNQIEVNISARDAGGIDKIEAFIDEDKVGEDSSAPYQIIVDISAYTSKNATSNKYKNYILKVVATDKSGNTSSIEQIINIDNELPAIVEVSLMNETVINGIDNTVTFRVSDNEALNSVKTYINNNLISEITDGNYEISINTLELEDGNNIFKIDAIDAAGNLASYIVNFVSDNTGPEISLDEIEESQIIDEILNLNPTITDSYSNVLSMEILLNDTSVNLLQGMDEYFFEFDPEKFPTGNNVLKLIAKDVLENESTIEIPINIHRRLITINIPENRIDNGMKLAIAFVSKMDGSLIQSKEILAGDREISFSVAEEFDNDTEFMLSFYLEENPYSNSAYISTHQNLTRSNPNVLNLAKPKYLGSQNAYGTEIPASNFLSNDNIIANGGTFINGRTRSTSRSSAYYAHLDSEKKHLSIATSDLSIPSPFNEFYLYMNNSGVYKYKIVDNPVPGGYILDKTTFTSENIERHYFSVPNSSDSYPDFFLEIFGATTLEDDYLNNYHQIYNTDRNIFFYEQNFYYDLNSSFEKYKHTFSWANYYTERRGIPLDTYDIPAWTLDYSNNGNTVYINAEQSEPILGRLYCVDSDYELHPPYYWTITFDSRKLQEVVIPDLPDNIFHTITEAQNNNTIKVTGVSIYSYQNIMDYDMYIQKVLKDNRDILDVTDWFNSIHKSPQSNYWYGANVDFPFNNY